MKPFISLFDTISAVVTDPKIFYPCIFLITESAAETAAVKPNGINTILTNGVNTFFLNGNLVFIKGPRRLPRNAPDYFYFKCLSL